MDETSGSGKPHQNTNPTKWPFTGDYVYDAANRMVEGTNTNGEKSIYNFNGLGMLVQNTWIVANNAYGYHKMEGTTDAEYDIQKPEIVVKDFVLDYNSPVQAPLTETEEGSNGLTYRYTYGLERVSVQIGNITTSSGNLVTPQNTVKLYYHTDRLGSYRYLTDDVKGKVTSWTDYDEWGQITHNAVLKMGKRQLDLVKDYTGHEYDSVLSLYYAKARMYDAQDKRFTQVDPAQQGLSWYAYCANNPIVNVDPNGKYFIVFGYDDNRSNIPYYYPVKQGTLATAAHIAGDQIPYIGSLSETILNTLESKYGVVGGNSYASNHNITNDISDWFIDEYKDAFIKNIENANKYAGKALKWCDSINNVIEIKTKVEDFGQIHIMDDQVFQLIELSGANVTASSVSLINDQPAIKFVEYRMDLAYSFVTQNAKYFWGEPWETSDKSYFAMQLSIYQAAPEKRSALIKKYRDSYYSYLTCSSVTVIKNGKLILSNNELAQIADTFQSEFLMYSSSTVSTVLDEFKSYVETPLGGYSAQILPF